MTQPKRVLCIMDLSCVGRAGLSVVLPALAACGAQGCGLPSALFSTHTGGYGAVARLDAAAFGQQALAHYTREGVVFDVVYTGYLNGEAQFALAEAAMACWPSAVKVVDPAMADDGRLYHGMDDATVARMRALCENADLITPNLTESALLVGEAPDAGCDGPVLAVRLEKLCAGRRDVIITSAPGAEDGFETVGRTAAGDRFAIPSLRRPVRYPGTGDLFAAAMVGRMAARGDSLAEAAKTAAGFVEAAVAATCDGGGQPRQGLWFEPFLQLLSGP